MKAISRIGIANRGEVAVRIIRACQELGIKTILLHSETDQKSMAYRLADENILVGPSPSLESYLNIDRVIAAALKGQVDAIHPGFGFLSENADFAAACTKAGIQFIGPTSATISLLGDKISARTLAQSIGIPTVPGYQGDNQSFNQLEIEAIKIGFPLIIKAAAGGGGRGLKVVQSQNKFKEMLEASQREALAAFGSEKVFLEKYVTGAKHIEFQIFGDDFGGLIHLGERECSVQRRHQKVIEEAPSSSLTNDLRKKMGDAAIQLAKSANYVGAGTVEFLLVGEDFYFMEVNTRLQVEHTVTEMVHSVDLVKTQILVAMGEPLPFRFPLGEPRGHAIECRLLAEDPERNGMPRTGIIDWVHLPLGPGRRFDFGVESGDEVTSFYDSMIAKVIIWDETRSRAIEKCLNTLSQTIIFGLQTNIPFLKAILNHSQFKDGTMDIRFLEKHFPSGGLSTTREVPGLVLNVLKKYDFKSAVQEPTTDSFNDPWFHAGSK